MHELDLELLYFEQTTPLMFQKLVDLHVELSYFEFGLEIDLVVVFSAQAIFRFLAVLAHHDDRSLDCGQARQDQIKQNVGIGIELFWLRPELIEGDPGQKKNAKENQKKPASAESGHPVRKLTLFLLHQSLQMLNAVAIQALLANKRVLVPSGSDLFDESEDRWSDLIRGEKFRGAKLVSAEVACSLFHGSDIGDLVRQTSCRGLGFVSLLSRVAPLKHLLLLHSG